ncbi:MAG TPA: hypothetical protein VL003_01090 [Pusillimonas sp.]|uniref:hypothetical protein n=1 Tax=Pusillimonas sp. TaxID=3040095 RepID=UPI002BCDD154|nr:hypothetical protein [Pusillimonas sp.]HUH86631.1 hypothetical protein [Pusillimonas sp.]
MKIGFLFLSILTMAATWWWATYRHHHTPGRLGWRDKRRIAVKSLLAGVAVYFLLLLIAALYMSLGSA